MIQFNRILTATNTIEIRPQTGFQNAFLRTPADICIGGGAAGAGKTFGLLLESLRYASLPDYEGTIFRKTFPQIMKGGGLWSTSMKLYPRIGGKPVESRYLWSFPPGSQVSFSHLEYEKNVLDWQGSQVPFIGFDELTHFSEYSFTYLLSRNRAILLDYATGKNRDRFKKTKPYIRATCNPDPDSWVADYIGWWINQDHNSPDYGFPIPERVGKIRFYMKDKDEYVWGATKKEVLDRVQHIVKIVKGEVPDLNPDDLVKSITFIPGKVYENKELLKADPGYLGNLLAQGDTDQQRLLHGNWKVKMDGDDLINLTKLKDCFTNEYLKPGDKYITADIALKGSDLLVAGVWDGWRLIAVEAMQKSKGDQVINLLKEMAKDYKVPQSNIAYDDNGAGSFVDGFIKNAYAFLNNGKVLNGENYRYLKDQCYFKMAERINHDGYSIAEEVLKKHIGGKTIEQHLIDERKAIKRDKVDDDGKMCVIPKARMKNIIGHSPDFMDMWMMREVFDLMDSKPQDINELVGLL